MKNKRARVSALVAGLVVAALVAVLATRQEAPAIGGFSALGGKLAPPISGTSVLTGKRVSLREERGRYVLVDFFASWCSTCLEEAPQLESFLYQHEHANDVAVIGVDVSDARANAIAFLRRIDATWPAVVDEGDKIAEAYGVASPPAAFLIDPAGRVVAHFTAGVTRDELDRAIAAAARTQAKVAVGERGAARERAA